MYRHLVRPKHFVHPKAIKHKEEPERLDSHLYFRLQFIVSILICFFAMLSAIESVVEKFNKDPSYLHTSKNSPNDILNPQKSVPTQKI